MQKLTNLMLIRIHNLAFNGIKIMAIIIVINNNNENNGIFPCARRNIKKAQMIFD